MYALFFLLCKLLHFHAVSYFVRRVHVLLSKWLKNIPHSSILGRYLTTILSQCWLLFHEIKTHLYHLVWMKWAVNVFEANLQHYTDAHLEWESTGRYRKIPTLRPDKNANFPG